MPLYDYRCPSCGLEFEVSRPMSRATEPAYCLIDKTPCERVISMPTTFVKRDPSAPPPPAQQATQSQAWRHFGHSHGPGAGGHSHGGT